MQYTLHCLAVDSRCMYRMLTFSFGTSIISVISGLLSMTGKYRPVIWVAFAVMTIGTGLMIMLDYTSSLYVFLIYECSSPCYRIYSARQEIFPLIAALGIGSLFQIPLVALQAAMPLKLLHRVASCFFGKLVINIMPLTCNSRIDIFQYCLRCCRNCRRRGDHHQRPS